MNLDKYLSQLIEDLRVIAKNPPPPPVLDIPGDMEALRDVIEWEHAEEKPMKEWFGIEKDIFPDEKRLNDAQVERLCHEIIALWNSFNFYPDLPDNLPHRITYKLLIDYLDQDVAWISTGESHIEFCHYDPGECPFPEEYCRCKDFTHDDTHHEPGIWEENKNDYYTENAGSIQRVMKHIQEMEKNIVADDTFRGQEQYRDQLLEDLAAAARKTNSYYGYFNETEQQSLQLSVSLITAPYITLEELSGIEAESFPNITKFHHYHVHKILIGIFKMLDAYNIWIEYPKGVPPAIYYQELIYLWDELHVQYLPESGYDLEVCTGNEEDCPFALYCNCKEIREEIEREKKKARERKQTDEEEDDLDLPF